MGHVKKNFSTKVTQRKLAGVFDVLRECHRSVAAFTHGIGIKSLHYIIRCKGYGKYGVISPHKTETARRFVSAVQ